jgi:hypothetical protein
MTCGKSGLGSGRRRWRREWRLGVVAMWVLDARQDLGAGIGQLRGADLMRLIKVVQGVEPGDDLVVERTRGAMPLPGRGLLGAVARGSGW